MKYLIITLVLFLSSCALAPYRTPMQQCMTACRQGDLEKYQDDVVTCECQPHIPSDS